MAPGRIITATVAAAAGVKAAPYARAFIPGNDLVKTGVVVVVGGLAIAGGIAMNKDGSGYAAPALIGAGGGLALGALCDHWGF